MTITKLTLQTDLVRIHGLSKSDAKQFVDDFLELILDTVGGGEKVHLSKLGTFEPRFKVARPGRNPKTGEDIEITERVVMRFVPSSLLLKADNEES